MSLRPFATTRTRCPRSGGGFTLIELVTVLVIVAIIAGTAAPAMNSIGETRAAMAGRQLLRDCSFARQWSIATGTRTWVVFDVSAETWSVLAEDPASPGRAGATVMTDPATGRPFTVTMGEGSFVQVEVVSASFDGDVEIGFDWLGRPLNATEASLSATGTVTLTGGHVVSVGVVTGHVRHVMP
jgi:prepilin-type N-terminal cleavage/methylation domain-containing protein